VTLHLVDVASYQGALRAEDVKAAGFGAVNLKISHGLGAKSVHPDLARWVLDARRIGLGISTFHFMTADAPGEDQAEYAYRRIMSLGLLGGTAHQMDVESDPAPSLASVRSYLERMTQLLGRPVALYTGDWWWAARKGWDVHDLSPYLWAAPNAGYLGSYPGDTSKHWTAGYGGWPTLAVMQYGVGPLPGGRIDVSKSAIRDETVWRDLTLGRAGMSYAPQSLLDARTFYIVTLKKAGFTIAPAAVGIVGDDSHANAGTSYHLGKDALKSTAYSIVESSRDRNGLTNAAAALDLGWFEITVGGKRHNLRTFSIWLVAQCKAGTPDTADIREVIYSTDGETVKRYDRLGIRTTGDSSHTSHTHISRFRDAEKSDSLTRLLKRYFTEIGVLEDDEMAITLDEIGDEFEKRFKAVLASAKQSDGTPTSLIGRLTLDQGIPNGIKDGAPRDNAWAVIRDLGIALRTVGATAQATLRKVTDDDAEADRIMAEVNRRSDELSRAVAGVPLEVLNALGDSNVSDEQAAQALAVLLGDRWPRIARMAG
jgi:hypothetical protein